MARLIRSGLTWLWIAILVVALDQCTKNWVVNHLVMYEPKVILPFFDLTLAYNTGAAFSFLHAASGWQHLFLGSIAIVVCGILIYWLSQLPSEDAWQSIAVNLIIGGALGNLWDRINYHYVIDFFAFHLGNWHFAIFNLADSAICVGSIMLIWSWFKAARTQTQ